jgi:exodeoxyribonuclease VII large subunit
VLRLQQASQRARDVLAGRLETARLVLSAAASRPILARPRSMVETRRQRLDDLSGRLERAAELSTTRWRHRLALAAGKLDAVSPLSTLARGYAMVTRARDETPVTRAGQVEEGDRLRIRLADGAVESTVTGVGRAPEG